jgi:hypothetical protein
VTEWGQKNEAASFHRAIEQVTERATEWGQKNEAASFRQET